MATPGAVRTHYTPLPLSLPTAILGSTKSELDEILEEEEALITSYLCCILVYIFSFLKKGLKEVYNASTEIMKT